MKFEKFDKDSDLFHVSMTAGEIYAVREAIGIAWSLKDDLDWSQVEEFSSAEEITKLLHAWERHAWNPTHAYPEVEDDEQEASP